MNTLVNRLSTIAAVVVLSALFTAIATAEVAPQYRKDYKMLLNAPTSVKSNSAKFTLDGEIKSPNKWDKKNCSSVGAQITVWSGSKVAKFVVKGSTKGEGRCVFSKTVQAKKFAGKAKSGTLTFQATYKNLGKSPIAGPTYMPSPKVTVNF